MNAKDIQTRLFEMRDEKYAAFHSRLCPSVAEGRIIGVRTPALRAFAKEIMRDKDFEDNHREEFLSALPHRYYEEDNIHAHIICAERTDLNRLFYELDRFLPYVDNWATVDLMAPKMFEKRQSEVFEKLISYLGDGREYVVRFGVVMLMKYFLKGDMSAAAARAVAEIDSEHYYVNMAIAWFMSEGLIKGKECVRDIILSKSLKRDVQNKSIQKAADSFRLTNDEKAELKKYKII